MLAPRSCRPATLWLGVGIVWISAAAQLCAQDQGRIDHILTPDRTLHAEGFEKSFAPATSNEHRSFVTRLFGGSHPVNEKVGGGWFHTSAFSARQTSFATEGFTTKRLPAASQSANTDGRTFATKTMDVREDRAADRTAVVRGYEPSGKQVVPEGKRQDDMDDLRRQKNLTVDQVREILNKKKN